MTRPAADLSGLVTAPNGGRFRWDAASADPQKQPIDIQFDTESGKGCGEASVTIRRPQDREYSDLQLLNELKLYLPDGQCVYEGRSSGTPVGDAWTFGCDGWYSHGSQRKFVDMIVDRDLGQWVAPTVDRYKALLAFNQIPDKDYSASSGTALTFTGQAGTQIPGNSWAELQYTAPPGVTISKVIYKGTEANTTNVNAAAITTDSVSTMSSGAAVSMPLTLDSTLRTASFSTTARYALVRAAASATHTPATTVPFNRVITDMAVYGNNSVPLITRSDGLDGYSASEGIKYLAGKYAPKWDLSRVQATNYAIPQGVWRDPTTVCEEIERMNSYHLYRLGCWPGRKLIFEPHDLTVADWQVRSGFDGATVEAQGDTTESAFNGMCVGFTDFQGISQWLVPTDYSDLRDTSDWIAANQWGDQAWDDIVISWQCTIDEALQLGRIALIDRNRSRRPATIRVPMHLQDINGAWQPSSLCQADQTIVIPNQFSALPRLITKTSWSNHTLNITTDNAIDTLGAFNARMSGALAAAGLI